ncbi:PREDICTED: uncharacterized protein LOC108965940 [Bactrocera latifrons]|uniref:uncharacterized protein LOC108965940 n=1 Tax=Bactrocera latifrons TaxID=174628 RepID=UPI0008DE62B2|nr:PREDICTED: uncharacterized protein LOC108965940 [Bactrocera latifrons]
MPEKAEVQAQKGDLEDEHYVELASKLPILSEEHVRLVEDKLSLKESTDAMMRLILKSKGAKGSVDCVICFGRPLQGLEGRKKKKSLLKLKCVELAFDIFPDKDKNTICGELRRFVALSHNRFKQMERIYLSQN